MDGGHSEVPCVTACSATGNQHVCVTADVTIKPCVICHKPTVVCLGPARIVKPHQNPCPGSTPSKDRTCRFTISQKLSVTVPVDFGANVECRVGDVFCLPPSTDGTEDPSHAQPELRPFLFTRSADFFQHYLFPANFTDEELCQAVQSIGERSAFLHDLLAGCGCPESGDPCHGILPLRCLNRLEALLTPLAVQEAVEELIPGASAVLGRTARQLLALLLNSALAASTPKGLVGGLKAACSLDLARFPAAAELLGSESTVGALAAAADAALMAHDAAGAQVLEPVLAAVNTERTPSILLTCP